jgi:hypothetical protein
MLNILVGTIYARQNNQDPVRAQVWGLQMDWKATVKRLCPYDESYMRSDDAFDSKFMDVLDFAILRGLVAEEDVSQIDATARKKGEFFIKLVHQAFQSR